MGRQAGYALLISVLTLDIKFTSFPFTLAWSFCDPPKAGSTGAFPQPTVWIEILSIRSDGETKGEGQRGEDGGMLTSSEETVFRKDGDSIDHEDRHWRCWGIVSKISVVKSKIVSCDELRAIFLFLPS